MGVVMCACTYAAHSMSSSSLLVRSTIGTAVPDPEPVTRTSWTSAPVSRFVGSSTAAPKPSGAMGEKGPEALGPSESRPSITWMYTASSVFVDLRKPFFVVTRTSAPSLLPGMRPPAHSTRARDWYVAWRLASTASASDDIAWFLACTCTCINIC